MYVALGAEPLPCYSAEFSACLDERAGPTVAACDLINRGYELDFDQVDAVVEAMPYCPAPGPLPMQLGYLALAVVAGAGIGIAVGARLKG
jgi:hypothetical protein